MQARRALFGVLLQRRQHPRWTADDDRLLGTMPDKELARRLGRTFIAVRARRSLKGILTHWHPAVRQWTPAELAMLGTKA